MRSPVVPVLATAGLVAVGVWFVLGTSAFDRVSRRFDGGTSTAGAATEEQSRAPDGDSQKTKAALAKKSSGKGTRNRVSSQPAEDTASASVPASEPATPAVANTPEDRVFPLPSDIREGMDRTQLRKTFGDPYAVATGADRGLQEMYVYHRKSDGRLTVVRLKDGVVRDN